MFFWAMMNNCFAIGFSSPNLLDDAHAIAAQYGFIIDNQVLPRLSITDDKLVLLSANFLPLFVDFKSALQRHQSGKKQGVVQACKPATAVKILDLTAGWGRDAGVLASFGATVLMLEKQPVMAALLNDGVKRALLDAPQLALDLMHTDALLYLDALSEDQCPDVIYIDPMHPERQKAALVKKDMQMLQQLFGADDNVQQLIQLALSKTKKRVVVKWPQRCAAVLKPTMSVPGKTVRFDIYLA